jgi:hypothetical protein
MPSDRLLARTVRTEIIDMVPLDLLTEVTQDFKDAGAGDVKAELNMDGTWKVSATFRDGQ